MSFLFTILKPGGASLEMKLERAEILFILGANGTGKSSLMQRLNKSHSNQARWISAHRQNWFASESIDLSPLQKRATDRNILHFNSHPNSRWQDSAAAQRADIAVYELVEAENADAHAIAKAVRAEDSQRIDELKKTDPPIEVINELLKASNLPLELFLLDDQVVASKCGCVPYSVALLSDGERNALLIAANVLTAKAGTLILVDEPERHLHRSIIPLF